MPPAEATKLLTRRHWRGGDVALLEAVAARLGTVRLTSGTPSPGAPAATRVCGVMRANGARFGGWLAMLGGAYLGCGAPADQLVPATQDEYPAGVTARPPNP